MTLPQAVSGSAKMASSAADKPTERSVQQLPAQETAREPGQAPATRPEDEVRICPMSGLSTLQGACPFAKPRRKPAEDASKPNLKLQLELSWEEGDRQVRIDVMPHCAEQFEILGLADTATQEEIRKRYRELALEHHPDKHPENPSAAVERFQQIKEAYNAVKDTDGDLGFPWEESPEQQQVMSGEEAIRSFSVLGLEACEQHHLRAIQLRHLVKSSSQVKVLTWTREEPKDTKEQIVEIRVTGLCSGKLGEDHLVKIYRRDVKEIP